MSGGMGCPVVIAKKQELLVLAQSCAMQKLLVFPGSDEVEEQIRLVPHFKCALVLPKSV